MKIAITILSVWLVLLCLGCNLPAARDNSTATLVPSAVPTVPATETPQPTQTPTIPLRLTEAALNNMSFSTPQYKKMVQLSDGKYQGGSGADYLMVTMLPQIAFGDLNGDGLEDAVILLGENGGGSGVFVSLIVVYNQSGKPVQGPSVLIDDRPKIDALTIQNGQIKLQATIHGLNDPMVSPTLGVKETYQPAGDRLDLVRLTSRAGDSTERSIQIDVPKTGENTGESVFVKGSMSVAPFENNLVYRLVDENGNQVGNGSFQVSAVDIGGPATFEYTLDLSSVQGKGIVRLDVFEESMADGSPLVLDSVLLNVP